MEPFIRSNVLWMSPLGFVLIILARIIIYDCIVDDRKGIIEPFVSPTHSGISFYFIFLYLSFLLLFLIFPNNVNPFSGKIGFLYFAYAVVLFKFLYALSVWLLVDESNSNNEISRN